MSNKTEAALERLIAAFEDHLEALRSDADEAELTEAEQELRDAFFVYDDVLFTAFDVELPFDMLEDDDLDYEEFDDEDFDDGLVYELDEDDAEVDD